jgi:hypothetical protein
MANLPQIEKKVRINKSKFKTMLMVFIDTKKGGGGNCPVRIHSPKTNCQSYILPWKFCCIWGKKLGHGVTSRQRTSSHCSISEEISEKKWILLMKYSSYSPDFTPYNFFSTPNHKIFLKGMHTGSLQEVQPCMTQVLKAISKDAFHTSFQMWKKNIFEYSCQQQLIGKLSFTYL